MLRSNLATRPFYNERAVHALLALAGVLLLGLTAFNVYRIVTLSRHNTELSSRSAADRSEAGRLTQEARRIRAGIDQQALQAIVAAAEQANHLIYQRTFSWTEFFNRIEETLPADVMLTSVQPTFREDATIIGMNVLARRTEDVEEFMDRLEETGAFENVLPQTQDLTDEGLYRVVLNAIYTAVSDPAGTTPEPAAPGRGDSPAAPPPEGGRGQ